MVQHWAHCSKVSTWANERRCWTDGKGPLLGTALMATAWITLCRFARTMFFFSFFFWLDLVQPSYIVFKRFYFANSDNNGFESRIGLWLCSLSSCPLCSLLAVRRSLASAVVAVPSVCTAPLHREAALAALLFCGWKDSMRLPWWLVAGIETPWWWSWSWWWWFCWW